MANKNKKKVETAGKGSTKPNMKNQTTQNSEVNENKSEEKPSAQDEKSDKSESVKETEAPKAEAKETEAPKAEVKEEEAPKAEAKEEEAPKAEAKEEEKPKTKVAIVEPPTAEEEKKKIRKISKYKGIPLKDFNSWITRPTRDSDVDINGEKIESDRVFCLKSRDIDDENLPAFPLVYEYGAKDENDSPILVAYKKPMIRNSSRGVQIKNSDGGSTTHHKYKQHTMMVEHIEKDAEMGVGLAGYWQSALTEEDWKAVEEEETKKAEAIAEREKAKEAKRKEREEEARKKAEDAQKQAQAAAAAAKAASSIKADENTTEAPETPEQESVEVPSKQKKEESVK